MTEASNIFWAAFGGGAAAGAVIGIIELIRWLTSRPLLKVRAELGKIVGSFPNFYSYTGAIEQPSHIFLIASNPHRASVTVSSFGFYYKRPKRENVITILPQVGYKFPYEVKGGKELTQWTDIQECLRGFRPGGNRPSDLEGVWFRASSGKMFRGKIDRKVIIVLEKIFQTQAEITQKDIPDT